MKEKKLYLVRHSKAEKGIDGLDIDRALNDRGRKDADQMSKRLFEKGAIPELMISSPAARTTNTALIFARNLQFPISQLSFEESLYESSCIHFLKVIKQLDDRYQSAMFFGHNPTVSELSCFLMNDFREEMPTSSVVCIGLKIASWKNIEAGGGRLHFFYTPAIS